MAIEGPALLTPGSVRDPQKNVESIRGRHPWSSLDCPPQVHVWAMHTYVHTHEHTGTHCMAQVGLGTRDLPASVL